MPPTILSHPWNISPKEAVAIQQAWRSRVRLEDDFEAVSRVAGVDVGFEENGRVTRAAVAVLDFHSLRLLAYAVKRVPTSFPYVPGLLSFREIPAVLGALGMLDVPPDMLLVDGQGIAHPRRFGIAAHLGVLTDLPAIGVGKTRLVGEYDPVPHHKGAWQPLMDRADMVGAVVRTRAGVKPVFVSPGHRVCLSSAIHYVMACVTRYRLPETTRWAHRLASGNTEALERALAREGFVQSRP